MGQVAQKVKERIVLKKQAVECVACHQAFLADSEACPACGHQRQEKQEVIDVEVLWSEEDLFGEDEGKSDKKKEEEAKRLLESVRQQVAVKKVAKKMQDNAASDFTPREIDVMKEDDAKRLLGMVEQQIADAANRTGRRGHAPLGAGSAPLGGRACQGQADTAN